MQKVKRTEVKKSLPKKIQKREEERNNERGKGVERIEKS